MSHIMGPKKESHYHNKDPKKKNRGRFLFREPGLSQSNGGRP